MAALAAAIDGVPGAADLARPMPGALPGRLREVFDTVVAAVQSPATAASTGYVARGNGTALPALERLSRRPRTGRSTGSLPRGDSIAVRDTLRGYTVDSVLLNLTLVARDTLVGGLKLYLYRLPSSVDSTATFAGIDPQFVDANLIDSIAVPDSAPHRRAQDDLLRSGDVGSGGSRFPPGGDSVLAIGLRMAADRADRHPRRAARVEHGGELHELCHRRRAGHGIGPQPVADPRRRPSTPS